MTLETWTGFYDPDFYELEIGDGGRVELAYLRLLEGLERGHVVEVGCGPGGVVFALARRPFRLVTGLDRSSAMLDRAIERHRECSTDLVAKVAFHQGELETLSLHEPADIILLTNELLLHVFDESSLLQSLRACRSIMAPGGRLLLDIPCVDWQLLSAAFGPPNRTVTRGVFEYGTTGRSIRVIEDIGFDPGRWLKTTIFRYEHIDIEGTLDKTTFRRLEQRIWTSQEIRFALALAGFGSIEERLLPDWPNRQFLMATNGEL